jgi:hypothetical protein
MLTHTDGGAKQDVIKLTTKRYNPKHEHQFNGVQKNNKRIPVVIITPFKKIPNPKIYSCVPVIIYDMVQINKNASH